MVQEDLCVLVEHEGRYRLEAASLCFPSHWRLHEKLGRSLAAIHAPVPHYAEELEAKVDRFFDRLRVDRPVVRRNLSIHCHDDLYRPEPHESPDSFAPDRVGRRRACGCAASARPWSGCPAPAPSCSPSRPSCAR